VVGFYFGCCIAENRSVFSSYVKKCDNACSKPRKKGYIASDFTNEGVMGFANEHTIDYLRNIRSNGRYAFTIDDLSKAVTKNIRNIRKDLDRLRDKGEIMNIRRGFYIIIPDEYRNMGTLPVELYADDLMKYMGSKYYVSLFSAAMLHGAAHQQPQEFFIINESPNLRNIKKDKLAINFSEKKNFPVYGIEERKTDTGFMKVSGRELTFFDLIYFEKSLGGYNRIITVLEELAEGIQKSKFRKVLGNDFPLTVFQRTGYVLEHIIREEDLASIIEERLVKENIRKTMLSPLGKNTGETDNRWKVQVNIEIRSDL
jgi:predicted transcriptional regulator of viral defense system